MPIQVTCSCGQKLKAGDELAGKAVKCPKCKQPLKIPAAAPTPEIDLSTSNSLASELDDLFSQDTGISGQAPLAGFNNPAQFGRALPTIGSQNSDGFPKWMLWAGGGITLLLLLGLGTAMIVTSLTAGKKPEEIAQAVPVNADGKPLAPDEVKDVDVAAAFQDQAREKKKEPAKLAKPTEPAEAEALPSEVDESEVSADSDVAEVSESMTSDESEDESLTEADELPSESEEYEEETTEEVSDEIDEATLQEIRDRIKNESASTPASLNIDADVEAGVRKTFDELKEAYRREVRDLFAALVDEQRFLEAAAKGETAKNLSAEEMERFKALILKEHFLITALFDNKTTIKFDSYELRRVEVSPNKKTVAVIVRTKNPDTNQSMKFRFWLCQHPTGWKIFDIEFLANASRASQDLTYSSGTRQKMQPIIQEMTLLKEAHDAFRVDDYDRLGRALDQLDASASRKHSKFARHYLRSYWYFDKDDFEGALSQAELAHSVAPNSPELFLVRAIAHTGLGNYGTAIPLANTYEKRLGPDERYWNLIGLTLDGTGHADDAIAAWERGLEYNSQFHILLRRLAVAYSPDNLDKMVPHIHKEKLSEDAFNQLIEALEADEMSETRDFLIEAREQE